MILANPTDITSFCMLPFYGPLNVFKNVMKTLLLNRWVLSRLVH